MLYPLEYRGVLRLKQQPFHLLMSQTKLNIYNIVSAVPFENSRWSRMGPLSLDYRIW